MRLSAKPIINWGNVNMWDVANQWAIRSGDPNTLYFQLIDLDQNGLRYLAGIGPSNQPINLIVTFPAIDNTEVVSIPAQINVNDPSIWSINISPNQVIYGGNVKFTLTEGSTKRTFFVVAMLTVENTSSCGSDAPIADVGTFTFQPGGPGFENTGV